MFTYKSEYLKLKLAKKNIEQAEKNIERHKFRNEEEKADFQSEYLKQVKNSVVKKLVRLIRK